ncbi:Fe-S cluster biogenesis protein NfuA/nitrite reductase/ring-hydroxylating ferredoxin subunit [Mycolicibacterium sp. BK556]|uniref:NifU family protein n=1 Tax=Mycobacteriaceae TaxID=1762 RepID=UPI00105F63A4|nr:MULTISPECIES: NifU family protein [Mycobacteriaceae]MBB3606303.1 Fe-S cluster biogenesis protein NfuA/nitrite reductase/ring-hydroxylating ferredoxin subunit [Mycolicibacterium sp. BK556]MBB3632882.1 Fe-S cluster biogenesis protein NfuA/nitrite reductase/ring-hydroxylating ferredoxin subunit [Mycolicibacterium sp. BK607]TDO17800.1 nitrite reductase/ring-hydroxylating ferredoxin subunit [Mycobacterium sp. BK086]
MSTTTERPVTEATFEDLAKRVDDAVTALDGLDPSAREVAEELKAAIEQIHRAGLVTMVRRMRSDDSARDVLFELVDDPTVHLLLSLHGIVRPDPVTHANQVLASVRPQLNSHGGDVTLVRVEDATAFVRLEGACNGCSMSSVTLRNLVEEALVQEVPAISAVEVLPNEPTPTLIPIEALRIGLDPAAEGWVEVGPAAALAVDELSPLSLTSATGERAEVIVVNAGQRLSAYRNECAHEALPLDNAVLDIGSNTLTCPWHGFCYDATSGECLSAPGAQLEQLPLRVDDGVVWVRVGG